MTYHNAVKYISCAPRETQTKHSFDRLSYLAELLGGPHKRVNYIHLAGSNGKTICSALLSSVLTRSGYNVCSLNMSELSDPKENIRHNALPLSVAELTEAISAVAEAYRLMKLNVEAARVSRGEDGEVAEEYRAVPASLVNGELPIEATRCELLLLAALYFYKSRGCDICIIESYHNLSDPSLFLRPPSAAVICGAIPSTDRAQISKIKTYIRRGTNEVISAPQDSYAYKVIADTCAAAGCRFSVPVKSVLTVKQLSLIGTSFVYGGKDYRLSLCGRFQTVNAITVIETLKALRRSGYNISYEAEKDGICEVKLRSRFEVISVNPTIIADSTYKHEAVEAVCESLFDFSEVTGRTLRLCLPHDASLIEKYLEMLRSRGYKVTHIYTVGESGDGAKLQTVSPSPTVLTTPKNAAKRMLAELSTDEILLVSGRYSFTDKIRLEILRAMEF